MKSMKNMKKEDMAIGMIAGAIIGSTAMGIAAKSMMKPKESVIKKASKSMIKSMENFCDKL